ncbi:MAG: UDP-3-O-(3-hydroxymyristoyl)glucosamine N-acyltransferase [Candidatus Omnitrophica bacterium]|nr:UDP-3-O-(3-hydroxymyristoyl)glucosamine N-acyltransferase [Candidatus Omnitrophota bacterium]
MQAKTKDIAKFVNGELVGSGEVLIKGINGVNEAREGDLAFVLNPQRPELINSTKASCVVVPRNLKGDFDKPIIKVDNPSIAFSRIIDFAMPGRIPHPKGVHASAVIAKDALIGKNVGIGPYVVVESGASIGDNTAIYSFCYIGKNTNIGRGCIIYPNVTIREEVTIGNGVIVHPGSVIGSDGFGYDIQKDGTQVKIPQLGTVVIEDDVEIGSCVTIDRARFNKTVIGHGSKIDNLVQIAHNVIIGKDCVIAGQSGISGSSELGRNCILGGQVGVSDHVKIGNFVMAGAKTGIHKSYPDKTVLFGYPSKPIDKAREQIASLGLLPKLFERVRALEAKIKELEK